MTPDAESLVEHTMGKFAMMERDLILVEMLEYGYTLQEAAIRCDLTKEQVRDIMREIDRNG